MINLKKIDWANQICIIEWKFFDNEVEEEGMAETVLHCEEDWAMEGVRNPHLDLIEVINIKTEEREVRFSELDMPSQFAKVFVASIEREGGHSIEGYIEWLVEPLNQMVTAGEDPLACLMHLHHRRYREWGFLLGEEGRNLYRGRSRLYDGFYANVTWGVSPKYNPWQGVMGQPEVGHHLLFSPGQGFTLVWGDGPTKPGQVALGLDVWGLFMEREEKKK